MLERGETLAGEGLIFNERPNLDRADWPEWFVSGQDRAWEEFQKTPMPKRTAEMWRFAHLKKLDDLKRYRHAPEVGADLANQLAGRSRRLEEVSGRMVCANGRTISLDAPEESGVLFLSMQEALITHPDLVEKYFMLRKAELGGHKFAALHRAVMAGGVFLYVPEGVELKRPLEIYHWLSGTDVAVFPHLLLIAQPNSKATVASYHLCADDDKDAGLSIGMTDLIVGEGADLSLVSCQARSAASRMIQLSAASVYRDGNARNFMFNLGSSWVRNEIVSYLLEQGANSEMYSVCVSDGEQQVDQRTLQHHEAPNTTSDLLFKNALYDRSRTIFAGLIKVDDEAHGTDAYQKCRNLLGSDEAEANSMPGLEINADGVKCSHGATTSQVEEEELFYLESRGIAPETARQMIALGFTREVISRIRDTALEEIVSGMVEEKFEALGA